MIQIRKILTVYTRIMVTIESIHLKRRVIYIKNIIIGLIKYRKEIIDSVIKLISIMITK